MQLRWYALVLVAVLLAGCAVYLSGQLVLYRAGETDDFGALVERQREADGLYFGLAAPVGNYKLAAYAARKPDIVILGSSRAHRQHQEFYKLSSYSMSGLVIGPDTALQLLDLLIPIHKPKVVIYNLDFFSVCQMRAYVGNLEFRRPRGKPQGGPWQPSNQFAIVPKLVANGALSPQDAVDFAFGRFDTAPKGVRLFGLIAVMHRFGFRLDGAISEVGARVQDANSFEASKEEIRTGTRHYAAGCSYDPTAMANLEFLQQDLDREGIKLVILLPPIAPAMYRLFMAASDDILGYFKVWQQEQAKRQFAELHEFMDGASIGASDLEFLDAVHGGDISEARMLLKGAERQGSILADIINRPFLERLVREHPDVIAVEMSYYRSADRLASGGIGPVAGAR
jgi:hypothetical protein